ncbi:helix-turn-helix domain-containing protein [Spirillospora albida]|uniref:helix-turn-helix domain-containing protein n=1 Tax=Spirillospora albida TaxID=58123 RepID=UPI00069201FD|nr:helix-turn-helix domain-containing protein [Spirillospora albida]
MTAPHLKNTQFPDTGPSATTLRRLYTVEEALTILNVSRSTLYREMRAGRLVRVKRGRSTRFTPAAIAEYVTLLEQESGAA